MSQTPVDGSDREGQSFGENHRNDEQGSLLRRVASRITSVGRSLRARLRSVTEQPDESHQFDPDEHHSLTSAGERTRSVIRVGASEEGAEGDDSTVTNDLVRSRTTDPSDREGASIERPELVVQWDDDELTLKAPDEPDAHITSTHWEDIER